MGLRPMKEADVSGVHAVETSAYTHPWTEGIFRDCLRAGYACWVLEEAGVILGYSILSAGAGEAHVLNVCVHPSRRREGFGRKLMAHMIERAREFGACSLFLEVRPSNGEAVRLYEELGFHEVGRRVGYYPAAAARRGSDREDALVFALELL